MHLHHTRCMSSKIETVAPDKDILIRRVVKLYMQRHETIKRRKKCREIKVEM